MKATLTIGELARQAGVPTSTLRYYERCRLLRPCQRSSGNYRLYDAQALDRLRFIRAAQSNGFTLDDITALLDFRDGRTSPCRQVQGLIEERLADLERRVEQMRQVQAVLKSALAVCREAERDNRCAVLEDLNRSTSARPPKPVPGTRQKK